MLFCSPAALYALITYWDEVKVVRVHLVCIVALMGFSDMADLLDSQPTLPPTQSPRVAQTPDPKSLAPPAKPT